MSSVMPCGTVRAQIISQDFPTSLPGYESDLTLPMQEFDERLERGKGIEVGDFNVQPSLLESGGYNTNPLGNSSGGSSLLETNAGLNVNSDWIRDALAASLSVDDQEYFDRPIASQTNWVTGVGGGLDFLGSRWDLAYSHLAQHLGPQQLGTVGVTTPVPYADDDIRFDDNLALGRIRLVPSFEYSTYSFGQSEGSLPADYSSLDRQLYIPTITGLFELSKGRSLVALIRDTNAQYPNHGTNGISNSYNDVLGFVGVDLQADAVIRLRGLVGGESRSFVSQSQQSKVTPAAELDVIWQPTRLTQVTTSFTRRLEDAAALYTGSALITDGRLQIDHSLRRNVELSAYIDVGGSDFASGPLLGPTTGQIQETFGGSAAWTLTRHVQLTLAYSYLKNDFSDGSFSGLAFPQPSYTTNVVTLGIALSQ